MAAAKFTLKVDTMKILMITPSYDPILGGTETVVKNLTIHLNEIGIHTDIITFNMDKKWKPKWKYEIIKENGFKIYRVPALNLFTKMPNPIAYFLKVNLIPDPRYLRILKEYDILHYHDDVDLSFPIFSRRIRKPKLLHCHTLINSYQYYSKNIFLKYIFKNTFDLHLAVSNQVAKLAKELGANQVRVLPNGVNFNKLSYTKEVRDPNLILYVGRFEPRKGIDVLLNSLDFLEKPVTLVLIGSSLKNQYYKKILEMVSVKNKKHSVIHKANVSDSELLKWYHKASIFVCPSLSESFGIVNIEAMACGTPVIASDIEGIRDIVYNGKNGILVTPNDPKKLAEAINYLLDNENIRLRLSEEGINSVKEDFTWKSIAQELSSLYNYLLE